ncbi:O-antigen ligase family protein [Mucilaginibacter sp.]|uniref:O-antigen ligase family protein n=1 Tax=Mucilaginibacter sp. TaxID=1882438 RepID=UPI003D0F9005
MERKGLVFYKSELWLIAICTFCLQMPDLKVSSIKISELLMLMLLPFYIKETFKSKTLILFFAFYVLFLFKTFATNTIAQFFINEDLPLLKHPYFISLSRFVEMLACIIFCVFILNALKLARDPLLLIKKFLFVQIFCFGLLYIFIFALYKAHLLHTSAYDNLIVYDTSEGDLLYRLRGFYVEGGPFGLFYAFLLSVCVGFYKKLALNKWYIIICIILVLMASSKAGYMMVVLTFFVFFTIKIKHLFKSAVAKVSLFIVAGVATVYISTLVFDNYIQNLADVEQRTANFAPGELDPNFMLGRISATVIVPNMLKNKWVTGIGWGNYPLVRNNPQYRTFMPEVPVSMWDATGFGGMLDLLLEAGVVLFLVYLFLYFRVSKLISKHFDQSPYIILSYIAPLLLGVSIYFFYTWFLLGIILFFSQKTKTDINSIDSEKGLLTE